MMVNMFHLKIKIMKYLKIQRRLKSVLSGEEIWLMDDGKSAWVNGEMKNYKMENGVLKIF